MTKRTISDVWSGEEEREAYEAADDDVVKEVTEVANMIPKAVCIGYEADVPDFTELDPGDGRLFPNIPNAYRDTIKWLINPQDKRNNPPLYVCGGDPSSPEKPEYGVGLTTAAVKVGQKFDVVSLLLESHARLRRVGSVDDHYVEPQTLEGKYVVVACVFAPIRWVDPDCYYLCQLRIVSEQLSEAENFEMVIVPKMRKSCAASKHFFHKFLSVFSGRLFVPFEDENTRDKICQSLSFNGTLKVVLLDVNHKVAQDHVCYIVANYNYPKGDSNTKHKFLDPGWIRTPSPLIENLSSSLAWILDSSYGDPNQKLHSLSSSDESTTVEQLSDKLVGVYIFQKGDKLESLVKVYDECRKKQLGFEIVVACVSMATSLDPIVFRDVVIGELKKVISDRPWWVLPYNVGTYDALFFSNLNSGRDTMITVGPRKKFFVDVHGGDVLHGYGVDAYPFHREMVVQRYEQFAQGITLDYLLCHGGVNHVLRGDKQVSVAELFDKVVVVYIDYQIDYESRLLSKWYKEIREQHSDFEVVFVWFKEPKDNNGNEEQARDGMDLLVRPYDPGHSKFLSEHKYIFMGSDGNGLPKEGLGPQRKLLFGKGGHLCSLNAVAQFELYGLEDYPYEEEEYLRDDIIRSLAFEFTDYMWTYGNEEPYDVISLD